jgi:hypothetical protein
LANQEVVSSRPLSAVAEMGVASGDTPMTECASREKDAGKRRQATL